MRLCVQVLFLMQGLVSTRSPDSVSIQLLQTSIIVVCDHLLKSSCLWQDKEHLELLWEAALSVTLQLRLCPTVKDKSLARNFQSEAVKALGHASLSDSFLTFAGLVRVLAIDKVQDGVAMGLAYNGAVYNAAIHKAALSMAAVLEDSDRHVEQSLSRLELQYGRDILSSEYSKLSKLIAYARSVSPSWSMVQGPRSNGEIMAWMVDMLLLAFKTKLRLPSKATEGWLDKDRKTGMPGYWQVCAVILQALWLTKSLTKILCRLWRIAFFNAKFKLFW